MSPREIMFAVELAGRRQRRALSERLAVAAIGANDPKRAGRLMTELED